METEKPKFADLVAALPLSYSATFVPFSKSRHAKPKPTIADLQLNWIIFLSHKGVALQCDYSAGIAHIPGYKHTARMSVYDAERIREACEVGHFRSGDSFWTKKTLPPPKLADVMYGLVQDASAIECANFEEWANEIGFNPDSRKDERIYQECLAIGLKLRRMIGDAKLKELRKAASDY